MKKLLFMPLLVGAVVTGAFVTGAFVTGAVQTDAVEADPVARGAEESATPNVFDVPRIKALQIAQLRRAVALMTAGQHAAAEQQLRSAVRRVPHDFHAHYNLACALAVQDKKEQALASLEQAVDLGFRDRRHIENDQDLKSLRGESAFESILDAADVPLEGPGSGWKFKITPGKPNDGQVVVDESMVVWNDRAGVFQAVIDLKDLEAKSPVVNGMGKAGELVRRWHAQGTAAGNRGDLYDNHDGDHSNMNYRAFPELTRIEFSESAKRRGLHNGLQKQFLYNATTIGNSSTALTSGPFWRCQGRMALTQPGGPQILYQQYRYNHLYFYPEHRDHDPGHGPDQKGYGDVFPANTPYLILSQGSSGSDRVFMDAVMLTLAAFPLNVKQQLAKTGTLMSAVQMIFRRSNKLVKSDDDYLTGVAHPTVFDGSQLDTVQMVTMAHNMKADKLPPFVQLKVTDEDESVLGVDYFDVGPREKLFDTPCAIARVVKSTKYERRMMVRAESSFDINERPLDFHWVVLRGDPERIRINPIGDNGASAELRVSYHPRGPILAGSKMESNRVDIGVFAHNGEYFSAPSFVSFYYLDNELREYDAEHRILSVDYTDPKVSKNYVDPLLDSKKDWRDEYDYAADGTLQGWTRIRGDSRERFTADGQMIVATDQAGKPTETREVRYISKANSKNGQELQQVFADD